jgi:hypothetical protein
LIAKTLLLQLGAAAGGREIKVRDIFETLLLYEKMLRSE